MLNRILALSSLVIALNCAAADADSLKVSLYIQCDTLLKASSAQSLNIDSYGATTSITVRKIDNTEDNFYYNSKTNKTDSSTPSVSIYQTSVNDVVVLETNKNVSISFNDNYGNRQAYSFIFPDSDNRSQQSYIGSRWSDFALNLSSGKSIRWDMVSAGLTLGWVTPTNSAPGFSPSMGRSIELGWLMVAGIKMTHRSFSISTGLGIDWRNFVTKGNNFFYKNPDGQIFLHPYDDDMYNRRSRIKVFSLQLPVLFELRFGKHRNWGLTAGPVINFNTSSSLKTEYKIKEESFTLKTSDIGQRPVTVDAYFAVHFQEIGLYARYSPMNMLKSSTGLDFGAFSTGVAFLF